MTAREVIIACLLTVGVLTAWICALGMLAMRNPYDRLHATSAGTMVPAFFITVAILVHGGFSQMGMKAILILLALVLTSPIATHAIGRAARIRETRAEGARE